MSELLVVEGLNGYYGAAHVLQDVSLSMGSEPVAVIGRNGMGKTTLCKTIVGLLGATGRSHGSVLLDGVELHGKPAYRIAKAGVGYVPQGRRLFTSLTVDEHLQIVGARPSEGSSMMSSLGLASSARPIASICCSPPESCMPPFWRRWARRGKSS